MGGGPHKTHEAYQVAPSQEVLDPPENTPPAADESTESEEGSTQEAADQAGIEPLVASEAWEADPAGATDDDPGPTDEAGSEPDTHGEDGADTEEAEGLFGAFAPSHDQALVAVPEAGPVGDPTGEALLIGGADLRESAATLLAYDSPDGPREVLHARVTPEAEGKLVEAIALMDDHKHPVVVDREVNGRLPLDEQHQLYEETATVAKSVNYHLKEGDGIPAHTHERFQSLTARLDELEADPARTEAEQAMLAHYRACTDELAVRLAPDYATPYADGGKTSYFHPYETTATVQVTEMVAGDPPAGALSAETRTASRINAALDTHGHMSWDGAARSHTHSGGCEYVIDLGEGYTAVYRPHESAAGKKPPEFSHRGALEVIAPPGGGHGQELVHRLGRLNLVNRPMSAAEGEWAYLQANLTAQGLSTSPPVTKALGDADGLEEATYHQLWAARADQAVGLGEDQLADFGRQLLLDAEARALPAKVAILRHGIAQATGHGDGDTLATSPGYDPTPQRAGGWLEWGRFDVTADPQAVGKAWKHKQLSHRADGSRVVEMLTNGGVLACTERRRLMGVAPGKGMSEGEDMNTGGAQSVFLHIRGSNSSKAGKEPGLYWDQPAGLLARADWYAYPNDHFGAINPKSGKYSASQLSRDPHKVAGYSGGELMVGDGIDLTTHPPSRIVCGSPTARTQALAALEARGITHLGGHPITDVVTS